MLTYSRFGAVLGFGLAASTMGCASVTFAPAVKSVGEYRDMSSTAATAEELPRGKAEDVKVMIGSIPPGMTVENDVLKVDPEQYEVLGRVEAHLNNPLTANLGFWVYDYAPAERWRVAYCAWQVPLSWVTLSLWAWLSPVHYPCKALMGDDEKRTAGIVETLKRAGKALGADLVVVPGIGGTTVISGTRSSAVVSTVNATDASGFAIKTKRPKAASADTMTASGERHRTDDARARTSEEREDTVAAYR
jgi:hypothetical protein